MRLNQVTVPCSDYGASVAFYKKLGLRQIVDSPPDYARFEAKNGATLSIHVSTTPETSETVVYFEVDDVDEAVRQLEKSGLAFYQDACDQPWLWREAYLRDPAGNAICIYHAGENRLNPPWRIKGEP